MILKTQHLTLTLLALSGILLTLLIPGGAIENRDFSQLNPIILLAFNIFLTGLGIGSFLLIPLIKRNSPFAFKASALCAVSYIIVYMIDLTHLFPQSPTPMSSTLFWTEVIGLFLAVPLLMLSVELITEHDNELHVDNTGIALWQILIIVSVALIIIGFATWSALGR